MPRLILQNLQNAVVLLLLAGCGSGKTGIGNPDDAGHPDGGRDAGLNDGGSDGGSDAGHQTPAGSFTKSLVSDGLTRTYYLHIPPSVPAQNAPLIMAFHGAGDTPINFAVYTGLIALADEEGIILVAPAAKDKIWVYNSDVASLEVDVRFALKLLTTVEGDYSVDPKRVYACGWSRGAGFSGILADTTGQTAPQLNGFTFQSPFAAYGLSAVNDFWQGTLDFSLSSPKRPVWIMHGTADQTIPYSDGVTFYNEFADAGYPATFTPIPGAPHDWLWQPLYGHTNEELWAFFTANALP